MIRIQGALTLTACFLLLTVPAVVGLETNNSLTAQQIEMQLEQTPNQKEFTLRLQEIVSKLQSVKKHEGGRSRQEQWNLIRRHSAYERLLELVTLDVACDKLVGLIGFGYRPRLNEISIDDLPPAAREVANLAPIYCKLSSNLPDKSG